MFNSRTLFIVGAGASFEAGLPAGDGLKGAIENALKIRIDGGAQSSGSLHIGEALAIHAQQTTNNRNINPWLACARQISDNVSFAPSIDHYMLTFSDNEKLVLCGKLAIVACILEAEANSLMQVVTETQTLNRARLKDSWYAGLWRLLVTDLPPQSADRIFQNVSFIVFNYDRCIEHYLVHSLCSYFSMPIEAAAGIVRSLRVFRLYGSVGALPWQMPPTGPGISFGERLSGASLLDATKNIRTFTEQIDEGTALDAIREEIQAAKHVVFLGCAFHAQNMDLLKPTGATAIERLFGTAYQLSEDDREISRKLALRSLLLDQVTSFKLENTTANHLLANYWRSITA